MFFLLLLLPLLVQLPAVRSDDVQGFGVRALAEMDRLVTCRYDVITGSFGFEGLCEWEGGFLSS